MTENYHSKVRKDIVHLVPEAGKLLDVGGGTGATARYLKSIGRAGQIGVMDAVVEEYAEGLDFWSQADLNDYTAVDRFLTEHGPFDVVLFLDVLEHLVDPWAIVDTFARHLVPGGRMVASIPNVRHYSATIPLLLRDRWDYTDVGILDRTHLRFFVKKTAVRLMKRPGLQIDCVEPSHIGGFRKKLADRLTFGVFRSFLTLQYFVVARRSG